MNQMSHSRVVARVITLSLFGGLMLVGACASQKHSAAVRPPEARRLVGGGMMIEWKAPGPGTVYLVEQQTGKLVETRSLDEGQVYTFAATSIVQADEFTQMLGIRFAKARFVLYFEPLGESGAPAVAQESLEAGSRL